MVAQRRRKESLYKKVYGNGQAMKDVSEYSKEVMQYAAEN
jgi:hypothetical protein